MKKFYYNGNEYKVQGKKYQDNGNIYDCLYIIKEGYFEGVIDGLKETDIDDEIEFKIVMENEYIITDEDLSEIKELFI